MYAQLSLVEKTNYTEMPRVLDDDLKRYYKHLDEDGEAFAKMVSGLREVVFEAVKEFDLRLLSATWLGSYLPEADRKELVGLLLDHYAENAEKLEEARKVLPRTNVAPLPNGGAGQGAGCPAPDPVTACLGRARTLAGCMNLLTDSSWHAQIPGVPQGRGIIPWDLLQGGALFTENSLTKANKFVER